MSYILFSEFEPEYYELLKELYFELNDIHANNLNNFVYCTKFMDFFFKVFVV